MGPSAGDRAPLPIVLLVLVAGVLAFTTDQPLVLGALAAGAVVLLVAAPGHPGRLVLVGALVSAAAVLILTPLVSGQGDLVLFTLPVPPPLNGEITAEELGAGAAAAARVLATVALAAALFAWADPDRMLAGVGRVAPRSALVSALAAGLVPTLRRDARAISETARLRGIVLTTGPRMARARRAAPLVADAVRLIGIDNARELIRGGPMAATGFLRQSMGSRLIEAMVPELGDGLRLASDPIVGQALAALTGVDVNSVARSLSSRADEAIWAEIGRQEAEIRAHPEATNDPVLIGALKAL